MKMFENITFFAWLAYICWLLHLPRWIVNFCIMRSFQNVEINSGRCSYLGGISLEWIYKKNWWPWTEKFYEKCYKKIADRAHYDAQKKKFVLI